MNNKPWAYVTSAWSDDRSGAKRSAKRYCRKLYEAGYTPICPLLYLPDIIDISNADEYKDYTDMSEDMLRRSRILVVCGTAVDDRYQWLVLEQKSQHDVEVRQTDSHGTITTRDNYELTRNIPKCVGVERLCKDANMQIPFTADEINLIYQFGEQSKAETCAHLSAILPQIKDNDTKQIVCSTLKKLNVLSEETYAELTATTKRRKLTERDHSIKVRLSKVEKQLKEPTITEGKQNRIGRKGKAGMEL